MGAATDRLRSFSKDWSHPGFMKTGDRFQNSLYFREVLVVESCGADTAWDYIDSHQSVSMFVAVACAVGIVY